MERPVDVMISFAKRFVIGTMREQVMRAETVVQ